MSIRFNNLFPQQKSCHFGSFLFLEATTGFEPVIRVLQTHALPLGHVALVNQSADSNWLPFMISMKTIHYQPVRKPRAGDEIRTRDLLLGKEAFYQLNYARMIGLSRRCRETDLNCRPCDFQSHALPTELSRRCESSKCACDSNLSLGGCQARCFKAIWLSQNQVLPPSHRGTESFY